MRVLIVEDSAPVLEQLKNCLEETFPDSHIETADNASDCRKVIREFCSRGIAFDVVILDAKVPTSPGENPEVDAQLCREIGQSLPQSLIVHFTAFAQDSSVQQRFNEHLKRLDKGRHVLVEKTQTPEYVDKLIHVITQHIYETAIQRRLQILFGPASRPLGIGENPMASSVAVVHVTQELSALQRDIAHSWKHLSDLTRSWIESVFYVTETDHGVTVGLLDPTFSGAETPSSVSSVADGVAQNPTL